MTNYYMYILLSLGCLGSLSADDCMYRQLVGIFSLEDQCAIDGRYLRTNIAPTLTIGPSPGEYHPKVTYEMYVYGTSTPAYISLKSHQTDQYVTRQGLNPISTAMTTLLDPSDPNDCGDDRLFVYGTTTSDLISLKSEGNGTRLTAYLIAEDLQPRISHNEVFWSLYNYMVHFSTVDGFITWEECTPPGRKRRDIPSGTQLYGSGSAVSGGLSNTPSGTSSHGRGARTKCRGRRLYFSVTSTNQVEISRDYNSQARMRIDQYQLYEGYNRFGRYMTGEAITIGIPNTNRYISVSFDRKHGVIPLNETRSRGGIYYMPQPIMYQSVITKNHDSMVPLPLGEGCTSLTSSRQPRRQPHHQPRRQPRPHRDLCLLKYGVDERVFKMIRTGRAVHLQHGLDSSKYLAALLLEEGSYKLVVTSLTSHISQHLLNFDFSIPVRGIPRRSYRRGQSQTVCRRRNSNRGTTDNFNPFSSSG